MTEKSINEIDPSPEYVKGFNEGYTMAKYMPNVAGQIVSSLGNDERSVGFKNGKEQLDYEIEITPKYMLRYKDDYGDIGQHQDKTMDHDDIEPELE